LTLKESIGIDGQVNAEGRRNVPRTITELYKRAIKILLFRHNSKYKNEPIPKDYIIGTKLPERLQNDLDKLKEIARDGMIKDQLIFKYENGDEFVAELLDCGLFNKLEDKRRNIFSFLHLTIQEFLAALHVVDDMENVESFLCEHIENPRWHLVIQFVAGLIGDKMKELVEEGKRYHVERIFSFFSVTPS
jgi:predicted NACHT family NTPase